MNTNIIDSIYFKVLKEPTIKKVNLYTNQDLFSSEDAKIKRLNIERLEYIEIVFQDWSTLCLGAYIKYSNDDLYKQEEVNEILNEVSSLDCISSVLYNETLSKYFR